VYFHPRKAGGSIVRHLLAAETNKIGLRSWIPCEMGTPCVPYSAPPFSEILDGKTSVYASHLHYVMMAELFQEESVRPKQDLRKVPVVGGSGNYSVIHTRSDSPPFDCMTTLRSTVDRVVSCWNYRMRQTALSSWHIPAASQMTPEDWERLLPITYDQYSNGCNNEIARTFGSTLEEVRVNTLKSGSPEFLAEFKGSAHRMSHCVITVLNRCEESNQVVSYFFPWLKGVDLCANKYANKYYNKGTATNIEKSVGPAESVSILSKNSIDELLYEFGIALFEAQLKIATSAANN